MGCMVHFAENLIRNEILARLLTTVITLIKDITIFLFQPSTDSCKPFTMPISQSCRRISIPKAAKYLDSNLISLSPRKPSLQGFFGPLQFMGPQRKVNTRLFIRVKPPFFETRAKGQTLRENRLQSKQSFSSWLENF